MWGEAINLKYPWPTEVAWKANSSEPYPDDGDRNEYDTMRCGPLQLIDGKWEWCNDDALGHIKDGGSDSAIGGYCAYCGKEL